MVYLRERVVMWLRVRYDLPEPEDPRKKAMFCVGD